MSRSVTIDVRGLPRPQGSMKMHRLPNGGTAVRYPAAVYAWRAQVQQAVAEQVADPFLGPVELQLGFDLPRPTGHFGTGRNAAVIKPSSPLWPMTMPDLDKLVRAVCDAITDAGLWKDDAQVCVLRAGKKYVDWARPGVLITVQELEVRGFTAK